MRQTLKRGYRLLFIKGSKTFAFEARPDREIGHYYFGLGASDDITSDIKTLTVTMKEFWGRFRASYVDALISDDLAEPAKRAGTDMQEFLKDSVKHASKKHAPFIKSHIHHGSGESESTPKGLFKITLRTMHEQFPVYVASTEGLYQKSYSLSEMEKRKPEGRELVDVLLAVQDKEFLKKNIKALSELLSYSYSDKPGTVVKYARERIEARRS